MLFLIIFKVALKSLFANKLRTILAMLGVIIGVGAVISMLAIGTGAQKSVMDRFTAMGTNLLVIRPGQHGSHGVNTGTQQNLTLEDSAALLKEVPSIFQISPVVQGRAQLKYFNQNASVSVIGAAPTYFTIRNYEIEKGRGFTEGETEATMRVAVLGPTTVENLFGTEDPLGQTVKFKGINFKIVGVTKSKGDQGWYNPDDQAIIPYSTAMKQLLGLDRLGEIDIQVKDHTDMDKAQADITAVLRRRHRTQAEQADDFNVRNQAEMIANASSASQTFTVLLAGIASISLLVGGIGIMNIMLVTVTERTREIGVRKAIGAKSRDILLQFLIEAVILSGFGGLIGVGVGVGVSRLIPLIPGFTDFSAVVQLPSVLLALGFAVAVGVFFGFYPARRAAILDPIEALRYE